MKAIILAAGKGTRLGHYTKDIPKGMLQFKGKSLIEHQVEIYHKCGIDDIIIITGYKAGKIKIPNVRYFFNKDYETTNMVESLMTAKEEFDDDIIVSYADILYDINIPKKLLDFAGDFVVTVDIEWKKYWKWRYEQIDCDTESLSISEDGTIKELGTPNPPTPSIDARYVGLLKFSKKGLDIVENIYEEVKKNYWGLPWQKSGEVFQRAYMTDLIQEIIDRGYAVKAMPIKNGWIELDTVEDYNKAKTWLKDGTLKNELHLKLYRNNNQQLNERYVVPCYDIVYEYSKEDRLEFPHRYVFPPYRGPDFINEYFKFRECILNVLKRKLYKLDIPEIAYGKDNLEFYHELKRVGYDPLDGYNIGNIQNILKRVKAILDDEKRIDTKKTLWALLAALTNNKEGFDIKPIIDIFVHKYEVSKRMYLKYSLDNKPCSDTYDDMEIYGLLSLICLLFYKRCKNLKYLNCGLKINDMLCSRTDKLVNIWEIYLSYMIINNEVSIVSTILDEEEIAI